MPAHRAHEYYLTKQISPKKPNPFRGIVNITILVVAIPVVIIATISILLYFFFTWIIAFFVKSKIIETSEEYYHNEMELLKNEYVRIMLVEDELDIELSHLNELWMDSVYEREACLFRAKSIPRIEELEGRIVCFYIKEQPGGVLLQLLSRRDNPLDTELVFLDYHDLEISAVDKAGNYYLYNDEKNASLILGFNKKERIRMELVHHTRKQADPM